MIPTVAKRLAGEEQFIRAALASPADGVTWLAWADWLEERGEPRSSFIRENLSLLLSFLAWMPEHDLDLVSDVDGIHFEAWDDRHKLHLSAKAVRRLYSGGPFSETHERRLRNLGPVFLLRAFEKVVGNARGDAVLAELYHDMEGEITRIKQVMSKEKFHALVAKEVEKTGSSETFGEMSADEMAHWLAWLKALGT